MVADVECECGTGLSSAQLSGQDFSAGGGNCAVRGEGKMEVIKKKEEFRFFSFFFPAGPTCGLKVVRRGATRGGGELRLLVES